MLRLASTPFIMGLLRGSVRGSASNSARDEKGAHLEVHEDDVEAGAVLLELAHCSAAVLGDDDVVAVLLEALLDDHAVDHLRAKHTGQSRTLPSCTGTRERTSSSTTRTRIGSIESSVGGATDALRYWLTCRGLLLPPVLLRRETRLDWDAVLATDSRRSMAVTPCPCESRRESADEGDAGRGVSPGVERAVTPDASEMSDSARSRCGVGKSHSGERIVPDVKKGLTPLLCCEGVQFGDETGEAIVASLPPVEPTRDARSGT